MARKLATFFLAGIFILGLASVGMAQHGHGQGTTAKSSDGGAAGGHSMAMMNRPVQAVSVEGYKISLDLMDMSMHASMQKMKGNPAPGESDVAKSHAIMVVIQDTASKEIITDAKMNYTLVAPSGAKEMGKLDWSGDHFGRGFNPKEKGAYQVQLKIESGGMDRQAEFTWKL